MKVYAAVVKRLICFIVLTVLTIATLFTGCGKSADDLYTEGRRLMMDEATFDKGIENLRRFEKKYPDDQRIPEVVLAVATGYQSVGKFDEATGAFNRLIETYPNTPEAYKGMFLLGYMYYDSVNDTEKAKTVLDQFITTYPDSELTVSAKVLLENIGRPVEDWSVVQQLNVETGH